MDTASELRIRNPSAGGRRPLGHSQTHRHTDTPTHRSGVEQGRQTQTHRHTDTPTHSHTGLASSGLVDAREGRQTQTHRLRPRRRQAAASSASFNPLLARRSSQQGPAVPPRLRVRASRPLTQDRRHETAVWCQVCFPSRVRAAASQHPHPTPPPPSIPSLSIKYASPHESERAAFCRACCQGQ